MLKGQCEQLFVSTHNYEFFNLLKDEFSGIRFKNSENCDYKNKNNHQCKTKLYQIVRSSDNAKLQNLDCLLCRFKSEYQYLFYQLHLIQHTSDPIDDYRLYTIPNILRRFLETYIGFTHPSTDNWGKNLNKLIVNDEDKKYVHKIADELSHNENIERAFTLYNPDEIKKAVSITFNAFESDINKKSYLAALKETIGIADITQSE